MSRRTKRRIGFLAAVGVAAALIWLFSPREKLLLSRAKQIASPGRFTYPLAASANGALSIAYPYDWESNGVFLSLKYTNTPPPFNYPYRQIARLDAATGTQTSLKALDARIEPIQAAYSIISQQPFRAGASQIKVYIDDALSVSPDGKWMLLFPNPELNMRRACYAVSLDGSQSIPWQRPSTATPPVWLPGSHQWLYLNPLPIKDGHTANMRVTLCDPDKPDLAQPVDLSVPLRVQVLGVTPEGRIVTATYRESETDQEDIVTFGFRPGDAPPRHLSVPVPPDGRGSLNTSRQGLGIARENSVVLSPQGDRLAWAVIVDYQPSGPAFLRRIEARLGWHPHTQTALWVSRLDGSDAREIGHIPIAPTDDPVRDVRWSPDGKRLSFHYHDALYVVPAD